MLALILVAIGTNDSYRLLRWDTLIVTVILASISISSRRYYSGVILILFGFLFNPFNPPSLSKTQWILADVGLVFTLLYWFWDYFNNYHKGLLFEKFVQQYKFPNNDWVLVEHTKDLYKKFNRFVESDSNPDLVFRSRASNKTIAIECKYRSNYWNHRQWGKGIKWDQNRGQRYMNYSNQNNIPVYIVIGVGGNPKSPFTTSFIPIDVIQKEYFKFIPKRILEQYQNLTL